ncbi:hypothetical protein AB0F81_23235 [Actinoplanes sp. NPDC024001]|uniref:hypothetical protein n=1 Tax=Actinoplanes sp. NPDC024001 TaxID=3154598 RepID=UPI00340D1CFC
MTLPRLRDRLCDCRCPLHHRNSRSSYDSEGCACLMTCSSQPPTLVLQDWGCALFLHPDSGHLWFVMADADGGWEWDHANDVDARSDVFEVSRKIEDSLRRIESLVESST